MPNLAGTVSSVGWSRTLIALHDGVSQVHPPTDDERGLIVALEGCRRVKQLHIGKHSCVAPHALCQPTSRSATVA